MYGWRARIGLMVPSGNTVMESESHIMAPEGVSVHVSRLHLVATNPEMLRDMSKHTERAAMELGRANCNAIVYGCTTGSFVFGMEWESSLQKKMEDASKTCAITTTKALIMALERFGKKNISIATPYIQELVDRENAFFSEYGYNVVCASGLGYDDNDVIGKLTPQQNYAYAKTLMRENTELLIISCTDFRSTEIIPVLERDLGIPVISSNQASFWAALRVCGLHDDLPQYGSLFQF